MELHSSSYEFQHFLWVDTLLESGASGVVTTSYHIPDPLAASLASILYEYLVSGLSVGDALLETRRYLLDEYQNPLGLAYTLYVHPDQQLFYSQEPMSESEIKKKAEMIVQDARSRIQWKREIEGIEWSVSEGVHRDIVRSIYRGFDEMSFLLSEEYIGDIWPILSEPQTDIAYSHSMSLWNKLWTREEGLPPFNMIQFLAEAEYDGQFYEGYRDHVVHSLLVYLLGLYIYSSSQIVREAMLKLGGSEEFFRSWKVAALFHDIGYFLNVTDKEVAKATQESLLRKLGDFIENPLLTYGEAYGTFSLLKADEKRIKSRVRSLPQWDLETITDLRRPFAPADGHILDELDDLVQGANLADAGEKRYCFRYDRYSRDIDADDHERCDDHGMISAMILLGQYTYFQRYVDALCKLEILEQVKALPPEVDDELPNLPSKVALWFNSVRQAAAAIALHNVHVTGWENSDADSSIARGEPYYLTLDQYELTLAETPLAWLLALTDALQCWDRPKRTEVPRSLKHCSLKYQEIRITATPIDKLAISFKTDDYRDTPRSSFSRLMNDLGEYMDDLGVLEEGNL
jgi:hypothetical protein